MQTRTLAATALTAALVATGIGASAAQANPGFTLPITCEFQSTWTKKACTTRDGTFPWNYSVARINASPKFSKLRANVAELCADDTFVQPPYAVWTKKGDTLWSLAVKYLGSGPAYKQIMKQNNLRSTTIKPGWFLSVKPIPAECTLVIKGR